MRIAAFGFMSEGAGSSAGAFRVLFEGLLAQGHSVDYFGIPGFSQAPSLERLANYRFLPVPTERAWPWKALRAVRAAPVQALVSQLAHVAYHRQAVRRIAVEHARVPYDVAFCTDTAALWPMRSWGRPLPIACWPQGPPQTEWEALRLNDVARIVIANDGVPSYLGMQLFYAYRWLQIRTLWRSAQLFIVSSRWAREAWMRFGVPPDRVQVLAYPLELGSFAAAPPPGQDARAVTFLWLGRAVPRKRFDLFVSAFEQLASRSSDVRALVVGDVARDPAMRRIPETLRERFEVRPPVPRGDVPRLLGECDVLVQPSHNENFGFSVAEALASGRPVVVGPTNGTAEYGGNAAFRFDDYTPSSVADAMQRASEAVRMNGSTIAMAARESARRHFAVDRVVERFCELTTNL